MICIKTDIPKELNDIDDELKAIYHSKDTVCFYIFKSRELRNAFIEKTKGMKKIQRTIPNAHPLDLKVSDIIRLGWGLEDED